MYRFFLSLSSFSAGGILYLFTNPFHLLVEYCWLMIVGAIIILPLFALCLCFFYCRNCDEYDTLIIQEIQPMEQDIIPIYIGLFVIVLNIGALSIFLQYLLIFILFVIWWRFLEQSYYFNIFWLIKYRLYKVKDLNGNVYSVYTKRGDIKLIDSNHEENLKLVRISNFSFIEVEV